MAISVGANKDALSLSEKLHMYKPFMKMQSAGYADVMRWSDGNYTAELLEPVPADVPGGSDYTGSTFRQTQVTNMNTTLSGYFSSVGNTIATSGVKKYVTPEWFTAHSIRKFTILSGGGGMSAVNTPSWFNSQTRKRAMVALDANTLIAVGVRSNVLYGAVATRTGTVWTWANEQLLNNATTWSTDPNGLEFVSTNKLVYIGLNNSLHPVSIVIDYSSGTLTAGIGNVFLGAVVVSSRLSFAKIDTNKIIVHYRDPSTSDHCRAIAATISGTTFTFGSAVTFETFTDTNHYFTVSHSTNAAVCLYSRSAGNQLHISAFTVSGTTITAGSSTNTGGATTWNYMRVLSSSRVLVNLNTGTNSTIYRSYNISGTTITDPNVSFSISTTTVPESLFVDGNDFYLQATVSSVTRIYKFTYTTVFTQVYARNYGSNLPTILADAGTGATPLNNINTQNFGSFSSNFAYTYNLNAQFPTLSIQVGSEAPIVAGVEWVQEFNVNSQFYRKSYMSITRTDAGTVTCSYSLPELLFETK